MSDKLHPPQETWIKAKIQAANFWQEAKGAANISPGLISPGINTCRAASTRKPGMEATGFTPGRGQECHHSSVPHFSPASEQHTCGSQPLQLV